MSNTSGVNKIFLVGCVETAPKKHTSSDGSQRNHFVLSTRELIKKGSQQVEHVEMHHVFIDCQNQEIQASEISRGAMLHITGKIKTRAIIDSAGIKQYKTEIMIQQLVFLQVPVEV